MYEYGTTRNYMHVVACLTVAVITTGNFDVQVACRTGSAALAALNLGRIRVTVTVTVGGIMTVMPPGGGRT
jgi:hypothetical protein